MHLCACYLIGSGRENSADAAPEYQTVFSLFGKGAQGPPGSVLHQDVYFNHSWADLLPLHHRAYLGRNYSSFVSLVSPRAHLSRTEVILPLGFPTPLLQAGGYMYANTTSIRSLLHSIAWQTCFQKALLVTQMNEQCARST